MPLLVGWTDDMRAAAAGVVVLARRGARVARSDNLVVLAGPDAAES